MKISTLACLAGTAAAFPSMNELRAAVQRRELQGSAELLGDLTTLKDDKLTKVGKEIKAILQGKGNGQSSEGYAAPKKDSKQCKEDECCIWKYINEELYSMMHDEATGTCNDFARGAIRMGFHDAAAWDKNSKWGGADGSLLLSDELTRQENVAMAGVGAKMKGVYQKYKSYGIGMADLIQAGAKVGVLACPGGPRVRMFVGRVDDDTPAPEKKLPPATMNADQILDLFADKTVSAAGLVALIGAHTASKNHNPQIGPVLPQDKTPGKWDTEYFKEHLKANASEGVIRFPSDVSIARSAKTKATFEQFSNQKGAWDEAYAREYIRMSLMGVKKINSLTECSKSLPKGEVAHPPASSSDKPDSPTSSTKPAWTPSPMTSTVYQSKTVTITSCPPEKTDCPYGPKNPLITYTRVPVSTTVIESPQPTEHHEVAEVAPTQSHVKGVEPTHEVTPVITAGAGRVSAGVLAAVVASLVAAFL